MELDHQQMAGASFGKPITAVVPGIWGDSSEVTAWGLHLFKSRHTRFHPFGSFVWFSLFIFNSLLTSEGAHRAAYAAALARRGRASEALELQTMAPWELATLGIPRLRKRLPSLQHLRKSTEASSNSLQKAGIPSEASF